MGSLHGPRCRERDAEIMAETGEYSQLTSSVHTPHLGHDMATGLPSMAHFYPSMGHPAAT